MVMRVGGGRGWDNSIWQICDAFTINSGVCGGGGGGWGEREVKLADKLQALVYDILPSATAVFSYSIGSRRLSANEQGFFFVGAQNSSKFVTNNSDYIRSLC